MFKIEDEIKIPWYDYVKQSLIVIVSLLFSGFMFILLVAHTGNTLIRSGWTLVLYIGLLLFYIPMMIYLMLDTYDNIKSLITICTKRVFHFKSEKELLAFLSCYFNSLFFSVVRKKDDRLFGYLALHTHNKIYKLYESKSIDKFVDKYENKEDKE